MKRSSAIALGAAGLVAGATYLSYPSRPAYCDNPVRTPQQDQECTAYRNRSSSSSSGYHSYSGWGSSGYSGSSSSSSTVSRGGFGSTGHSMGVSS